MAGQPDLPDDLRREIDDALARGQADRLPSEPVRRPPPRRPAASLPDWRPRKPSQLLLVGALAALVGWMLPVPFRQEVLWIGLALAAVALLSMLLRPQGRTQRYWRGRPVDLPAESWTDRLYRLLYRG